MAEALVCPDTDLLSRLLRGTASEAEMDSFAQHLETCPQCGQQLDQMEASSRIIESIRRPETLPAVAVDESMQSLIERLDAMISTRMTDDRTSLDHAAWLERPQQAGELGRLGGYRVLGVLGSGGMGVVYLAEDQTLKRPVALKVMNPSLALNQSARERFLREARAAAAVRHDHIVTIYQAGEANQVAFLAMELLKGETLEDRLKRDGRLPLTETIRIGREVAEGLGAAHGLGLIHRDIKPGNLWLEEGTGRVKILDFGLARAVEEDVRLTNSGSVLGTPAYMAPEQAAGNDVDARADLYSLGCVLYRVATGQLPFPGQTSFQIFQAVATTELKPPHVLCPDIPAELSEVIMKLLAKRPNERLASADLVMHNLRALERIIIPYPAVGVLKQEREPQAPPTKVTPFDKPATPQGAGRVRRLQWPILVGAVVVCVLAAFIYSLLPPARNVDQPEPMAKNPVHPVLGPMVSLAGKDVHFVPETVGHHGAVAGLAYQPKGKLLATTSGDGTLRLWDTDTGKLVRIHIGSHLPGAMDWSPDGKLLAVTYDKEIWLWDGASGKNPRRVAKHEHSVSALAWSSDGKRVATGDSVGNIRFWDTKSWDDIASFSQKLPREIGSLAWSPDSRLLAASCDSPGPKTEVFQVDTGMTKLTLDYRGPTDWADNTSLLAIHHGEIRLIDVQNGNIIQQDFDKAGFNGLVLLPGRKELLVRTSETQPLQVRTLPDLKIKRTLQSPISPLGRFALDSSGQHLAVAGRDGDLKILDLRTEKISLELPSNRHDFMSAAFSPNSELLATASESDVGSIWDAKSGKLLHRFSEPIRNQLEWSGDGKHIAAISVTPGGNALQVWEWPSLKLVIKEQVNWERALSLSPDGKFLFISQGNAPNAKVYELKERRVVATPKLKSNTAAWSPDSKFLALGDGESISVFAAPDFEKKHEFEVKSQFPVQSLLWSRRGDQLISWEGGEYRAAIKVRAFPPGNVTAEAGGNFLYNPKIALKPDGKVVGCAANFGMYELPNTGTLCDAVTGKEFENLGPTRALAWAPNDSLFVQAPTNSSSLRISDGKRQKMLGTMLVLGSRQFLMVGSDGHCRNSAGDSAASLVYVVQTKVGQETLTPAEMEQRFGWRNDPTKVSFLP